MWGATAIGLTGGNDKSYFNPRSPCGERRTSTLIGNAYSSISIHAPRVGSDSTLPAQDIDIDISIHAPRVGSDGSTGRKHYTVSNISIHAPRVGSDAHVQVLPQAQQISIHAPRVGSDMDGVKAILVDKISIHAPRVGSDANVARSISLILEFQSTLPVWGATRAGRNQETTSKNFNPRSPCGERPSAFSCALTMGKFQSTLPVWGATASSFDKNATAQQFQSTLPVWGATQLGQRPAHSQPISIHAPRVGSDGRKDHRPCERPQISIHAPRVGSD